MKNILETQTYPVSGKGMYDITKEINFWVSKNQLNKGHLNLFIQHTSASLTIMENASPDVLEDINNFFMKLVPEDASLYEHGYERISKELSIESITKHLRYLKIYSYN